MLLPDGSSREKFGSFFSRERALHRFYRSLDRFDRLRRVLATLQVVCNLFRRQGPSGVLAWDHLQRQQVSYKTTEYM